MPHPLEEKEGVGVVDAEPETVMLELEEKEPLRLAILLTVPAREAVPEAEPRKPSAAAPPEALELPVPHPLLDLEGVVEVESEPEPE